MNELGVLERLFEKVSWRRCLLFSQRLYLLDFDATPPFHVILFMGGNLTANTTITASNWLSDACGWCSSCQITWREKERRETLVYAWEVGWSYMARYASEKYTITEWSEMPVFKHMREEIRSFRIRI